jgi:hypothetical protein
VLPRAFVVHKSWSVPDQEQAFNAIHRADYDPATTVVVEGGSTPTAARPGTSEARIVSYSNNEIRLQASTSTPGYLVMSEVYYPGWKAEVDGHPADLQRANYAFRAVLLRPGAHQVRLYFQPTTWKAGMLCSLFTWAVLAVAVLRTLLSSWQLRVRRTRRG